MLIKIDYTSANYRYRSGTGFMTGFENIIQPDSKYGKALLDQGYDW
jgi:hypothetical protein